VTIYRLHGDSVRPDQDKTLEAQGQRMVRILSGARGPFDDARSSVASRSWWPAAVNLTGS